MTGFSQISRLWSRTTKASYGLMTREMRSSLVSGLFFGSPAIVFLFQGHKLESKFVTLSMAHTIRLRSRQELTRTNNSQLAQPSNNACVQESGVQRCHQRVPPSQNTNKPGGWRYSISCAEQGECMRRVTIRIENTLRRATPGRSAQHLRRNQLPDVNTSRIAYLAVLFTNFTSNHFARLSASSRGCFLIHRDLKLSVWCDLSYRLKRPFWPANRKYQQILRECGAARHVCLAFFCIGVEQAFRYISFSDASCCCNKMREAVLRAVPLSSKIEEVV